MKRGLQPKLFLNGKHILHDYRAEMYLGCLQNAEQETRLGLQVFTNDF